MTAKTPIQAPILDTPDRRWAYILQLWHTHNLPTPSVVDVRDGKGTIWLPRNERGQAEAWAVALGIGQTGHLGDLVRQDGTPKAETYYCCTGWGRSDFGVYCYIDLTADAEVHGGPVVRTDLAAAADAVVAMLADEPNPVCNKPLGVESYCALDADHDGDCRPVVHGPVDGAPGVCVCGFEVDGFTAPELLGEKLAMHIAYMNQSAEDDEDGLWGGAFLYACPTCGAQPKHWCNRSGEPDADPFESHEERSALYAERGEPTRPQLAAFWKNEDGTVGSECACGVTYDGFDPKDAALLDNLFAEHECNTLPPVCGFIGGCNYGADLTPAPAEADGLCTRHFAEVYPESVGGGA